LNLEHLVFLDAIRARGAYVVSPSEDASGRWMTRTSSPHDSHT
jgi:hypothetical protein